MAAPPGGAQEGAPPAGVLSAALAAFPPVAHAFAYGSGVFAQPGAAAVRAGEAPMLDFIFAVDDPVAWHAANLERNRRHYSLLGAAGASAVAAVAEHVGAGVHFNAFARVAPLGEQRLKYGVVALPTLLRDLRSWDALYVAGRMHKPVSTLAADARVAAAEQGNLAAAVAVALLLLPERFSERQLHATLCGLSYTGDVRMAIAEDASKVDRIAEGSAAPLRQLYRHALERAAAWHARLTPSDGASGAWAQDCGFAARQELLSSLPPALLARLAAAMRQPAPVAGAAAASALATSVAAAPLAQAQALLRGALGATVAASSRRQALAGLLTAGLGNATRYVSSKVLKAWRSRAAAAATG